jgi:hypothetical protein
MLTQLSKVQNRMIAPPILMLITSPSLGIYPFRQCVRAPGGQVFQRWFGFLSAAKKLREAARA